MRTPKQPLPNNASVDDFIEAYKGFIAKRPESKTFYIQEFSKYLDPSLLN
jgi:hypothetical protein